MIGFLYIDNHKVGEVDLEVIDETMGGIGGKLLPNTSYENYRKKIQSLCNLKGIACIDDFHFKIILIDNTIVDPEGGIGVTDSPDFEDIYVESAGIQSDLISRIRINQV